MSDKGYICLDRGALRHDFFRRDAYSEFEAWVWLLGEAAWRSRQRRVGEFFVHLERGQLVASVRHLMAEWEWSQGKVDRFVARLKGAGMVVVKTDTGISVITVCNYNEYQGHTIDADTATDTRAITEPDTRPDTRADQGRLQGQLQDRSIKPLNHSNIEPLKIDGAAAPLLIDLPVQTKPKKKPPSVARTWPDDFIITPQHIAFAMERGFVMAQINTMFERFRDYHLGKGSKFADWSAAWRTWVNNQVAFTNERNPMRAAGLKSPII